MKVKFKVDGKSEMVEFRILPKDNGTFAVMAKSSQSQEVVQRIISDSQPMVVRKGLLKHLESKLKIPLRIDLDYQGAGFGFKIDMYSLLSKL